jgi:hypothetical protein
VWRGGSSLTDVTDLQEAKPTSRRRALYKSGASASCPFIPRDLSRYAVAKTGDARRFAMHAELYKADSSA